MLNTSLDTKQVAKIKHMFIQKKNTLGMAESKWLKVHTVQNNLRKNLLYIDDFFESVQKKYVISVLNITFFPILRMLLLILFFF